jgi:signal transduction histidine kinase
MVEERNRMARDIHDTLAQGFTGIVVQLNAGEEMLAVDPARARGHLATARELARTSLQEARRSVWALRPPALEQESLAAVLERSARTLTSGTGIEIAMQSSGETRGLGLDSEWEVLRIGQEAVANAVRHSGSRRIALQLFQGNGWLRLEVDDDGKGGIVPEGNPTGPGGLGLLGMYERARRIGGRLEVQSPPGGPTRISLMVPEK